jgi:cell division protein ZapA
MAEASTKQITVLIAGRPYPLKIKSNDEAIIRKLVKDLNEKVNRFQLSYPNRDKQDCMAMTMLGMAVDLHQAQQGTTPNKQLAQRLVKLEELFDQLLD